MTNPVKLTQKENTQPSQKYVNREVCPAFEQQKKKAWCFWKMMGVFGVTADIIILSLIFAKMFRVYLIARGFIPTDFLIELSVLSYVIMAFLIIGRIYTKWKNEKIYRKYRKMHAKTRLQQYERGTAKWTKEKSYPHKKWSNTSEN